MVDALDAFDPVLAEEPLEVELDHELGEAAGADFIPAKVKLGLISSSPGLRSTCSCPLDLVSKDLQMEFSYSIVRLMYKQLLQHSSLHIQQKPMYLAVVSSEAQTLQLSCLSRRLFSWFQTSCWLASRFLHITDLFLWFLIMLSLLRSSSSVLFELFDRSKAGTGESCPVNSAGLLSFRVFTSSQ